MSEQLRLPRAAEATIPTAKLVDYVLSAEHTRGRHKARVFASALGIRARDWEYLRDQLLSGVREARVRATRITPFGVAYEVAVDVDGLNGAKYPVVTTWIVERGKAPRLTSAWVDIP